MKGLRARERWAYMGISKGGGGWGRDRAWGHDGDLR